MPMLPRRSSSAVGTVVVVYRALTCQPRAVLLVACVLTLTRARRKHFGACGERRVYIVQGQRHAFCGLVDIAEAHGCHLLMVQTRAQAAQHAPGICMKLC
eukprot:TRINITY_DN19751_c0_g1_i1.p2 TRINITY_DN19751_c0_g1~~TRINITY_DN19751_c0_g1_i1.p2  ORF type:complete len:100 (+),score=6.45 TRINITY_DN19751_c0_g1_i1:702-1001(+)